jgi:flagellar biosynthesis protein FlhF
LKIRRFVADDMQQALFQVKRTFGSDALILQTRKFRQGGFLGFFGRDLVEVIAAADEGERNQKSLFVEQTAERFPLYNKGRQTTGADSNSIEGLDIKEEIKDIKLLLGEMRADMEITWASSDGGAYPGYFKQLYRTLQINEVEDRLARIITNQSMEQLHPSLWDDRDQITATMEGIIAKYLLHPSPLVFKKENERKRVALVGPTGVGKTTTIAKLAAIFSILEKKRVALATLDTYRVAAVEQLKTYADIIGVPLEVAYTPKELQDIIAKHEDKNLILIDTAGRSPLNELAMAELHAFLESCPELDIFLVLGATTKQADLANIISRFGKLSIDQLIFTKLDETTKFGVILNIVNSLQKGLAYITTGQRVPDDIEVPDQIKLARMIMRVSDLERSSRQVKTTR